ncbi:tyrosine-type recombinase/integrase [Pseudomonas sp. NPDC089392]|uniref:tyrosine-type recombinase/integrase n=1 Tax=Pseudomonas sp. NPDC089392 TaxID=3364459 RepID=UPI0038105403
MELVWATGDFVIAGRPYPGFPILLWDSMESCAPANDFLRHYLLRGGIGSKKSWPSTARALYDFFSFLQSNDLDWRDVDRGEAKNLLAVYRDYCLIDYSLARSTTRQRLLYICKFYEHAQLAGWIRKLPFRHEERILKQAPRYFAHLDAKGGKVFANDIMPPLHRKLPKFLTLIEAKKLLSASENPHHRMIIRLALQTGLRREEIATFPLSYISHSHKAESGARNFRIRLDPFDGLGMLTKGSQPRDIYVSNRLVNDLYRYLVQVRGERSSLSHERHENLFLNQFGVPFSADGKGIERIVRSTGEKVGIRVHPHMLRHTYATHTLSMLQRSAGDIDPLVFVQRQLGHASIQSTMIYLHLVNEAADSAVLAYDDEINSFAESI